MATSICTTMPCCMRFVYCLRYAPYCNILSTTTVVSINPKAKPKDNIEHPTTAVLRVTNNYENTGPCFRVRGVGGMSERKAPRASTHEKNTWTSSKFRLTAGNVQRVNQLQRHSEKFSERRW